MGIKLERLNIDFKVDVEKPLEATETIPLVVAKKRYSLDDWDIETIARGDVLWVNDIALTKSEEL